MPDTNESAGATRVKTVEHAPQGTAWAPDAFAGNVGKTIPVNTPAGPQEGRVVACVVADDGRSVEFTLDLPADALGPVVSGVEAGPFSLDGSAPPGVHRGPSVH